MRGILLSDSGGIREDLRSVIAFFTIFPVGSKSLPTPRGLYFLSTLGLGIGLFAGLVFFWMAFYFGSVSAVIIYVVLITAIPGFHHLDSVLDVGDALMARGDSARMVRVMKDTATGAGAIGMFMVVYGTTAAFALSIGYANAISVLALAESVSKLSLIVSARGRKALGSGMGSSFLDSVSRGGFTLLIVNLAIPFLVSIFLGISYIIPIFIALIVSFIIASRFEKMLSGINGDVLGFSGEVSRMVYIVSFVLISIISIHYGALGLKINV